jgi:two-component system, chemotaxis family, chemotaxis protein CheY
MRVLIVDDSRTSRMILKKALPERLLSNLVEASGGSEALEICRREAVELMFLDLTMPELDGYQVLATLNESGTIPPTIVVSADVQPKATQRVLELGAFAFLKKTPSRVEIETILAKMGLA